MIVITCDICGREQDRDYPIAKRIIECGKDLQNGGIKHTCLECHAIVQDKYRELELQFYDQLKTAFGDIKQKIRSN